MNRMKAGILGLAAPLVMLGLASVGPDAPSAQAEPLPSSASLHDVVPRPTSSGRPAGSLGRRGLPRLLLGLVWGARRRHRSVLLVGHDALEVGVSITGRSVLQQKSLNVAQASKTVVPPAGL